MGSYYMDDGNFNEPHPDVLVFVIGLERQL